MSGIRNDLAKTITETYSIKQKYNAIKQFRNQQNLRDEDEKSKKIINDFVTHPHPHLITPHEIQQLRLVLSTRHSYLVEYFIIRNGITMLAQVLASTNLLSKEYVI